jgi:hypothetical protein
MVFYSFKPPNWGTPRETRQSPFGEDLVQKGLIYFDLAKLKRTDIFLNHLFVVTQKTADRIKIELNKIRQNERIEEVHPKYSLLSCHCGRRTFVVNGLYLGIPPHVIMEWTGHYDYKSMKPYIKVVDKLKEKEMTKFNISISE